jgi:predicted site-specific integrase-resolvase
MNDITSIGALICMTLRHRSDQKGYLQPTPQSLKNQSLFAPFELIKKEFLFDWMIMVSHKRVAIYARVSTVDKGQDPETQVMALRQYAEHRGFEIVGEYIDYASGAPEDRPRYRALLEVARKRQIDIVLVWRYDCFARSTQAFVQALKAFHTLGVDFISYQENIDTTTPQSEMIFTVTNTANGSFTPVGN